MSVEHEIFHTIPARLDVIEVSLKRIEQKLDASAINRDMLDVSKKLCAALNGLRPFPLVVEPVAAALIAEADAAIARAEAHEGQRNNG